MKLSEIQEGSKITLRLMTKDKKLQLDAVLKKHIRENIAIITLTCDTSKKLTFDNVRVDLEYSPEGDVPLMWYSVKVVNYKDDDYAMQVFSDGTKHNRRGSFRVGVSSPAKVRNAAPGTRVKSWLETSA